MDLTNLTIATDKLHEVNTPHDGVAPVMHETDTINETGETKCANETDEMTK